jgi:acyl carrier protein
MERTMLTKDDVLTTIKTNMTFVMEEFDETAFDPIKSMRDHGANSLEMIEIVSRTMRQLKVKVPRVRLNRVNNIDELANEFVLIVSAPERG